MTSPPVRVSWAAAAIDFAQRVMRLLIAPAKEFERLGSYSETLKDLAIGWIVPLALFMIVGNCIRALAFGVGLQGTADPYYPSLVELVLWAPPLFIESVAMPFVGGAVVNILAPFFGGKQNYTQAVRVVAYSSTPGWLVGALWSAWEMSWQRVMPPLSIILFISGLWGMYLLQRGLPLMTGSPPQKATIYTLAVAAVLGVLWILALLITYGIISRLHMGYIMSGVPEY